jgi:hypothetical protein
LGRKELPVFYECQIRDHQSYSRPDFGAFCTRYPS